MRQGVRGRQGKPLLDAVLGGVSLLSLDSRLTVTEAQEVPAWDVPLSQRAVPHGQFPAGLRRKELEIRLALHMKAWDMNERCALYQKLSAWAGEGQLEVSWRPGQVLQVDTGDVEGLPSLVEWTRSVTVRLTAHLQPFFRDAEPQVFSETGTDTFFPLTPPGNMGAKAEVLVVSEDAREMNDVFLETFSDAGQVDWIRLTGLHLRSGVKLEVRYDDFGLVRITAGGKSVLLHRSAESSDELRLLPGKEQTVHVLTGRKAYVEVKVYGLYA